MRRSQRNILPVIIIAFATAIFASVFVGLHAPTSLGDGIRHHTLASLLSQNGVNSFAGWGDILYQGYFSLRNSDPWFLTHVLLMPLSSTDIITAQRIFILLSIVLVSLAMLYAMRRLNLSATTQAVLLTLLLFGHVQFSMRLLLGRPLILMVAMSIVVWSTVLQKKAVTTGVLLCIATLLSHMFPFPLFIAVCGCIWLASISEKNTALKLAACTALGVVVGIALHPQSLSYVHYMLTVFLREPFLTPIHNATEMQSGYARMGAMAASTGMAILLAHYVRTVHGISWREMHTRGISLTAGIVVLMLFLLLLWTRMMDFLWPLQIVLLGQLLSLRPHLMRDMSTALLPSFALRRSTIAVLTLLIVGVHTGKLHHSFRSTDTDRLLSHFSVPLRDIPAKSRILNADWDLFPALFTVRPDLLFTRGMSPSYDYVVNPDSIALFQEVHSQAPGSQEWQQRIKELILLYPADYLVLWIPKNTETVKALLSLDILEAYERSSEILVVTISPSAEDTL